MNRNQTIALSLCFYFGLGLEPAREMPTRPPKFMEITASQIRLTDQTHAHVDSLWGLRGSPACPYFISGAFTSKPSQQTENPAPSKWPGTHK
jgi:hypothetical protein